MNSYPSPYILGLTGSIGSGKSFVTSLFAKAGAKTACADEFARQVVEKGSPALQEIADAFGKSVLDNEGNLDRKRLAEAIFRDRDRRQVLECIIHPRVRKLEEQFIAAHQDFPLLVIDVPLLFESHFDDLCHGTLVVLLNERVRYERLMKNREMSREEVDRRLSTQMPQQKKARLALFLVDNSLNRSYTCGQVNRILRTLFSPSLPSPLKTIENEATRDQ